MPWFTKVADFLSAYSLLTALVFALPVYFSARLYEVSLPFIFFLLAFLVGLAIYSYNKVTDKNEDIQNGKKYEAINPFVYSTVPPAIYSVLAVTLGLLVGGLWVSLVLLVPLIVGFLYSKKVFNSLPRLKDVLGVKNIAVAFSIAFIGCLFPILGGVTVMFKVVFLVFMYIFVQLFINTVLFDIFDMKGDGETEVNTLPLRFKKKPTVYFLLIINTLLFLWFAFCYISNLFVVRHLLVAAFGIFYNYFCIWYFTKHTDKRPLAEILVDGLWVILATLIIWCI